MQCGQQRWLLGNETIHCPIVITDQMVSSFVPAWQDRIENCKDLSRFDRTIGLKSNTAIKKGNRPWQYQNGLTIDADT